jgi:hypothetical protein
MTHERFQNLTYVEKVFDLKGLEIFKNKSSEFLQ